MASTSPDQHSALYVETEHFILQEFERIEREKITPWAFFHAGPPMRVTDFFGKVIFYEGVRFEGIPREKFWGGFIEPFLKDLVLRVLDRTARLAEERGIALRPAVVEAGVLLNAVIRKAYSRMRDIDRQLRGGGYPERVPPQNIEDKVAHMNEFLDACISGRLSTEPKEAAEHQLVEKADPDATAQHVFRQVGEHQWELVFEGESVKLNADLVGLRIIKILLESPRKPLDARKLRALAEAHPLSPGDERFSGMSAKELERQGLFEDGGGSETALDQRAIAEIRTRLQEVTQDLEEASKANDVGRISALQPEVEQLLAELERSTGLGGRRRTVRTGDENARTSVRKSVQRVLTKLSRAHPSLAKHLHDHIETGKTCVYSASLTWVTTPTE